MAKVKQHVDVHRSVEFQLDIDKVLAAATYIASRNVPELTIGKICKLVFLADKYHLVKYGRPITGDRYAAMKDGPVPSFLYSLFKQVLKEPFTPEAKKLSSSLRIDLGYEVPRVSARIAVDPDQLSKSDIGALDLAIERFGRFTFAQLRALTHEMVAYENAWSARGKKDSVPMKFEDFFEEDEDALAGTKEEMVENYALQKLFAKPRAL